MKMPIEWHKKNLVNVTASVKRLEDEAIRAQNAFIAARCAAGKLEAQIRRAELEGKDGFDQDKFKATE